MTKTNKVHQMYIFTFPHHACDLAGAINELICTDHSFYYRAEEEPSICIDYLKTQEEVDNVMDILNPFKFAYYTEDLPF